MLQTEAHLTLVIYICKTLTTVQATKHSDHLSRELLPIALKPKGVQATSVAGVTL